LPATHLQVRGHRKRDYGSAFWCQPPKADFEGRIRGIVHDISASGATIFIEPLSVVELNNVWRELHSRSRNNKKYAVSWLTSPS